MYSRTSVDVQLSNPKLTLPTLFKPVILTFLLSDLIVTPPRGLDNRGSTVFTHKRNIHVWTPPLCEH